MKQYMIHDGINATAMSETNALDRSQIFSSPLIIAHVILKCLNYTPGSRSVCAVTIPLRKFSPSGENLC